MSGFICCVVNVIEAFVLGMLDGGEIDPMQLITDLIDCFTSNCQLLQGLG